MKKFLRRFKVGDIAVVLLLIIGIMVQVSLVYAGTLTNPLWDRLNRLKVGQTSGETHRLVFEAATNVSGGAGLNRVYLFFPDGDDGKWVRTAGSITVATSTCASEEGKTGLPGDLAASSTQGTGASSYDTIEIWGVNNLTATTEYCVDISGSAAVLGTSDSTGSKVITVTTNDPAEIDRGKLAVSIITNEQVAVSAIVDPSITFTLAAGGSTLALGTLSTGAINTASSSVVTTTNALQGFSTVVSENNNLWIDVSNDINDATGTVEVGVEGYGMSTTDTGQGILNDSEANCTTPGASKIVSNISATWESVSGATIGPVTAETHSYCLAASVTSATTAGTYGHTLTFVSTANF